MADDRLGVIGLDSFCPIPNSILGRINIFNSDLLKSDITVSALTGKYQKARSLHIS